LATAWRALSPPSIAELRAVTQPDWLLARRGAEHWAGRLYMRRISPYLTQLVVRTTLGANALTSLMIPAGLLAALLLTFSNVAAAVGAVLLVQVQLLLDCSDGEVARWRRTSSATGIYLDQLAHYSTEAAIPAALGVRADGGWGSIGGWTALGLAVSVLILLLKSETHLVLLARARSGRPETEEPGAPAARSPRRLRLRDGARLLPFFRPFHAVEGTFLGLAAAVADALAGGHSGTRVLLVFLAGTGVAAVLGHVTAVLVSKRLESPGAEASD
jgi:phosphatidylglycerophosphate synthase